MSNLYEVSSLLALVMNHANNFSKVLGTLSRGTQIDAISISNGWVYFKYNNNDAYIKKGNLKAVNNQSIEIKGSITLKYIDNNTGNEIYCSETLSNLELESYTYEAKIIYGYKLISSSSQSISLTESNPNQTITFYYNQILGSITIKYIDKNTNSNISESKVIENLSLGTYSYGFIEIYGYKLIDKENKSITLTESTIDATITFNYEKILGSVTINYLDYSTFAEISPSITITNLSLDNYSYDAIPIDNYEIIGDSSISVTLTSNKPDVTISFKYKNILYIIELQKFSIFNDNTEAVKTTKGINDALIYAKGEGYKKVQLPAGNYSIDTSIISPLTLNDDTTKWTHNRKGIIMQSNLELILTDAVLKMIPTNDPYYSILTISGCENSKITNGTILGDKLTHDYGHRINNDGNEFEIGSIDETTGKVIEDTTKIRTKNFISEFKDWFTQKSYEIPKTFNVIPLWNTSYNTVDGGKVRILCYDSNENFLGISNGGLAFGPRTMLDGTKKIKVVIYNETHLNAVIAFNQEKVYYNPEFTTCINLTSSKNITIDGVVAKESAGDCIQTFAAPLNVTVDNLNIINCTLENSRRQGISFTATGENYLIKNCNIGKIQGTDPQSGIDFEHYKYVRNVIIDNCNFYDNKKIDILNYNAWDIEIKNCKFNGSVTSTFGYNMDIHDNEFIYYDAPGLDKYFKGSALGLGTNKTEGYFKVYNNYFEGYMSSGGNSMTNLTTSLFTNNTIVNSHFAASKNWYNNCYKDSKVRYTALNYEYKDEKLTNCTINTDNNGENTNYRYFTNFTINNCTFSGGALTVLDTILNNCTIFNDDKSFCSTWSGKYTIKNSTITTNYKTNIPFISQQACEGTTFDNCIINISCTPFIKVNYKTFIMSNCTITFNPSYQFNGTIAFFDNGNNTKCTFANNKFYKNFEYPKVILPTSTNSTVNDTNFTTSITI